MWMKQNWYNFTVYGHTTSGKVLMVFSYITLFLYFYFYLFIFCPLEFYCFLFYKSSFFSQLFLLVGG